jgi:hypothetical protein
MAGEKPTIVVEGVDELVATFRRIDRRIARGLQDEIRGTARDVAAIARRIATEKGLGSPGRSGRGTGDLVNHIKVRVRGGSAFIVEDVRRVSAKYPAGYPYAKVYEYGSGGVRAFMHPAAREAAPLVMERTSRLIDRVISGEAFKQ